MCVFLLSCRQICPFQPEHASQFAAVGRQERLRHGRSHHCVRIHAGSTNRYVTSVDLKLCYTWWWCCCILTIWNVCVCVCFPGEALLESNTVIDYVYCSPSLRCVQTAQNILRGTKSLHENRVCTDTHRVHVFRRVVFVSPGLQQDGKLKVRVEPGLFEWTKWVSGNSLPAWIPPTDLAAAHFSVDTTYRWCVFVITCSWYVIFHLWLSISETVCI